MYGDYPERIASGIFPTGSTVVVPAYQVEHTHCSNSPLPEAPMVSICEYSCSRWRPIASLFLSLENAGLDTRVGWMG